MQQERLGLIDTIRADVQANPRDPRARLVLLLFRLAVAARGTGTRPRLLGVPVIVIYKLVVEWVLGIDIPIRVQAGPGLGLRHGYAVVVHPDTVIGRDVILKHGVTLGHRGAEDDNGAVPVIGDRVVFGPHAQVLGGVTIGDGARIGAGAIVVTDVPAGAAAIGVPARIVKAPGGAAPVSREPR